MTIHLSVLKALLKQENFKRYNEAIDYQAMRDETPEVFKVSQALIQLHKAPGDYSFDDLRLAVATAYPASDHKGTDAIIQQMADIEVKDSAIDGYLEGLRQRTNALALAKASLAFAEGRTTIEEYNAAQDNSRLHRPSDVQLPEWIDDDLEKLYHQHYELPGLRWGLDSLNKSLGSLRLGDFGFVFARPETGKTTFLASQLAAMSHQLDKPLWWFSNEQSGEKILTRCYQSVLGISLVDLYRDRSGNRAEYLKRTKGNIRIYYDPNLNKSTVERLLHRQGAGLIIFDQIDPLKGFKADRDDLELTAIYEWARSLAGSYAPVIGVSQAGQSGEGKRWLTMNDVMNSKTGKQGAADWILGIGKAADDGLETYRYLHLSKNKLQGDVDTDPKLRHAKFEVKINAAIARYEDL